MARMTSGAKPKNTKKTLQQLLRYLGKHKIALFFITIFVCISAASGIVGTYLLKEVVNKYIIPGDIPGLIKMIISMGIIYAAGVVACFFYNKLMVHTSQKVVSEIRSDLFEHTEQLPINYFDTHTHGELMSHFTNDVDTISEALNNSFTLLIQSFITSVGTVIMLLILSWQLSIIVIIFLLLMLMYIRYNGKMSKKYFTAQQKNLGAINGYVEEMVAGQKVEKIFNHEAQDYKKFCELNEKLREASTKANTYTAMTIPTIVSLSYINYAISACVGGLFALSGLTDIGTLASYLVYVRQSAMPMNQFTIQINFLMVALASAEKIFAMMEEEHEVDEGQITLKKVKREADGTLSESDTYTGEFAWNIPNGTDGSTYVPLRGEVHFHDVVFGYTKEHTILNGINLFAKPGQKIAFVGSTGAGKTTIINLINRFYEITEGQITYDGIDIRDIKKADLRRSISFIIQDTHLFTGTIADNIRYGRLQASDEDVVKAAKLANAHSFIKRLPNGYDTLLESDGANLSQGQRQLLAIARAAISQPPVLVMDEATSSIDTRTEKLIEKGMDTLMENRTVFVIAHRLSTVRNSKAILVLEQGKVMERGDHEELLTQEGLYYKLYTGQFELD
ncbi:ABC transporter [Anaerocolumna cellulosilytica]|uniref:ABC transporter n=1 Tax=Anaerocolumna cellulosilytica TaxID=433286 RepID=A0A6S6R7V3_9FIRM|nr:ABC transporter ATP-binding protein [Anaerocolumna cellulosilytica]MBB5195036.1 ATP-binding cassette subfamily B protein [Anaerocolumna cellulosilytica]BCJ96127.1 ABC transporter [Anaerocolumna cellulosilytica]